ncbi:MAG: GGDEF domain-containing protein [Propionivibrio sp.]|uniref:GGDEF domain-containing protein n=1 Tax=Propionivibrio sp. TaxID=2212460 RepID=UPI001A3FD547|nr:GGDEF domain-containing protein [Propionivibrio sp.]MBL8414242.1 GGDEF domain-containing protein [Propionivibrio sp.]
MNAVEYCSPLPNACYAEDEEIRRYAGLLDSLSVGLVVFADDASPCLNNKIASQLLGNTPPIWKNENGQTISSDELPLESVLRTARPVLERIMGLSNGDAHTTWLSVNALPVFSENGSVRRVLLTLKDINAERILHSAVKQLSIRDPLTGLFNQRYVMHLLENEIHRARRYGTPFTLAQVDIDRYFPLCAEQGQASGDSVLAGIGNLLGKSLREIDIAGRIGEDEFLLVLPNVSLKDAMIGLERLRVLIEAHEFANAGLKVTISGGITEYTGENSAALIERSKSLLINAREAGRNRFCLDTDIL